MTTLAMRFIATGMRSAEAKACGPVARGPRGGDWVSRVDTDYDRRIQNPASYHWTTGEQEWFREVESNHQHPGSEPGLLPIEVSLSTCVAESWSAAPPGRRVAVGGYNGRSPSAHG